jgi:hypothetical protein
MKVGDLISFKDNDCDYTPVTALVLDVFTTISTSWPEGKTFVQVISLRPGEEDPIKSVFQLDSLLDCAEVV